MTGASSGTAVTTMGGKLHSRTTTKYARPLEAFISLQLEKVNLDTSIF